MVRTRVSREIGFNINKCDQNNGAVRGSIAVCKRRCYCACTVFGNFGLLGC